MAIIGFLFLSFIGLCISGGYLLLCSQVLPKYNIGGVPSKWYAKVAVLLLGVVIIYGWIWLFSAAPFTIQLK